jgi:hypothetical protein
MSGLGRLSLLRLMPSNITKFFSDRFSYEETKQPEASNSRRLEMAKKSGPTPGKRLKEIKRLDKRKAKEARRIEAKERKVNAMPRTGDEDPDIAGIRPGPQPLPEQWDDLGDDE